MVFDINSYKISTKIFYFINRFVKVFCEVNLTYIRNNFLHVVVVYIRCLLNSYTLYRNSIILFSITKVYVFLKSNTLYVCFT